MDSRILKRTLFIYFVYSFLISSILGSLCVLIEYAPSARRSMEKFVIGATFLNCVLWGLVFTITGSASLFNTSESIGSKFLVSLLCFVLLPLFVFTMITNFVNVPADVFGFSETETAFLAAQLFFFFRFRSCIKRTNQMTIE